MCDVIILLSISCHIMMFLDILPLSFFFYKAVGFCFPQYYYFMSRFFYLHSIMKHYNVWLQSHWLCIIFLCNSNFSLLKFQIFIELFQNAPQILTSSSPQGHFVSGQSCNVWMEVCVKRIVRATPPLVPVQPATLVTLVKPLSTKISVMQPAIHVRWIRHASITLICAVLRNIHNFFMGNFYHLVYTSLSDSSNFL